MIKKHHLLLFVISLFLLFILAFIFSTTELVEPSNNTVTNNSTIQFSCTTDLIDPINCSLYIWYDPGEAVSIDTVDIEKYQSGITTNGTFIWGLSQTLVDGTWVPDGVVSKYFMNGTYIENFSVGSCTNGITTNNTYFWIGCNGNQINQYFMNGTYISAFNHFTDIYDLEVNGDYLWVSNLFTQQFSKYYKNGTNINNFTSNTTGSISTDGTNIWISNLSIDCVDNGEGGTTCSVKNQTNYRYNLSGNYKGNFLSKMFSDNSFLTNIYSMSYGDYLWISSTNTSYNKLFKYKIAVDPFYINSTDEVEGGTCRFTVSNFIAGKYKWNCLFEETGRLEWSSSNYSLQIYNMSVFLNYPVNNFNITSYTNSYNASIFGTNIVNLSLYANWSYGNFGLKVSNLPSNSDKFPKSYNNETYAFNNTFSIIKDSNISSNISSIFLSTKDIKANGTDLWGITQYESLPSYVYRVNYSYNLINYFYINNTTDNCDTNQSESLAFNGTNIFVPCYLSNKILVFDINGNYVTSNSLPNYSSSPRRYIYANGMKLWNVELSNTTDETHITGYETNLSDWSYTTLGLLYNYTATEGITRGTYSIPSGLLSNGTDFWYLDDYSNYIYHYNYSFDDQRDGMSVDSNWGYYKPSEGWDEITWGLSYYNASSSISINNFDLFLFDYGRTTINHVKYLAEGSYVWNYQACDDFGTCIMGNNNQSLNVDYSDINLTDDGAGTIDEDGENITISVASGMTCKSEGTGTCGNVTAYLRYNNYSDIPNAVVTETTYTENKPFFINSTILNDGAEVYGQNSINCGVLNEGDTCNASFIANRTNNNSYNVDILFVSDLIGVPTDRSGDKAPGDLTWIVEDNNYRIYESSSLVWDSGTWVCNATITQSGTTVQTAISNCTGGQIKPSTNYRIQFILKNTAITTQLFYASTRYVRNLYVLGANGWSNTSTFASGNCSFKDFGLDDTSPTCRGSIVSSRDINIYNSNTSSTYAVKIKQGETEGFSYVIRTGAVPKSTATSYLSAYLSSTTLAYSNRLNITNYTNTAPQWSTNSTNSTLAGSQVKHNIYWTDNSALSGYIFGFCNGSYIGSISNGNKTQGECQDIGGGTYCGNATISDDLDFNTGNNNIFTNFSNFTFDIPTGKTINGIEIYIEGAQQFASSPSVTCFNLSWDGASTFTSVKRNITYSTTSDVTVKVGNSTDTWGRTWSSSDFNNGSFFLGVTGDCGGSGNRNLIDQIKVAVYYENISSCSDANPTFINDSWVAMTGTTNWSNVTKVVNSTIGSTIKWKVYANDSANLWNSTSNFNYITTGTVNRTNITILDSLSSIENLLRKTSLKKLISGNFLSNSIINRMLSIFKITNVNSIINSIINDIFSGKKLINQGSQISSSEIDLLSLKRTNTGSFTISSSIKNLFSLKRLTTQSSTITANEIDLLSLKRINTNSFLFSNSIFRGLTRQRFINDGVTINSETQRQFSLKRSLNQAINLIAHLLGGTIETPEVPSGGSTTQSFNESITPSKNIIKNNYTNWIIICAIDFLLIMILLTLFIKSNKR